MAGEQQATQPAPDAKAILRGEHVLLRALRRDNADRLEAILREPEVARWWGGHDADARRIVEEIFEDPGAVSYAIQAQGELVGLIRYQEENAGTTACSWTCSRASCGHRDDHRHRRPAHSRRGRGDPQR